MEYRKIDYSTVMSLDHESTAHPQLPPLPSSPTPSLSPSLPTPPHLLLVLRAERSKQNAISKVLLWLPLVEESRILTAQPCLLSRSPGPGYPASLSRTSRGNRVVSYSPMT